MSTKIIRWHSNAERSGTASHLRLRVASRQDTILCPVFPRTSERVLRRNLCFTHRHADRAVERLLTNPTRRISSATGMDSLQILCRLAAD
jgi:hypothetical protein